MHYGDDLSSRSKATRQPATESYSVNDVLIYPSMQTRRLSSRRTRAVSIESAEILKREIVSLNARVETA